MRGCCIGRFLKIPCRYFPRAIKRLTMRLEGAQAAMIGTNAERYVALHQAVLHEAAITNRKPARIQTTEYCW